MVQTFEDEIRVCVCALFSEIRVCVCSLHTHIFKKHINLLKKQRKQHNTHNTLYSILLYIGLKLE
jgi:hypothetical protein